MPSEVHPLEVRAERAPQQLMPLVAHVTPSKFSAGTAWKPIPPRAAPAITLSLERLSNHCASHAVVPGYISLSIAVVVGRCANPIGLDERQVDRPAALPEEQMPPSESCGQHRPRSLLWQWSPQRAPLAPLLLEDPYEIHNLAILLNRLQS